MRILNEIENQLVEMGIYFEVFDMIKIIDAESCKVLEIENGCIKKLDVDCIETFGLSKRCKNCSALKAYNSKEQVLKLEYLQASVFLVLSVPLYYGENLIIAEMLKDITKSSNVGNHFSADQELSNLIDNLNNLAIEKIASL